MTKNNKKNIWIAPADIPQNTVFMMGPPLKFFFQEWPRRGLGDKLTKYFTLYKGDFSQMCYLRHEFDAEADFLSQKMLVNPLWALKIIDQVKNWSNIFFVKAKKFKNLAFAKMSARDMIKEFNNVLIEHQLSHGLGASVSWHADAEKERVSKGILKTIDDQIKNKKIKLNSAVVFSLLSTPRTVSIMEKEELDLLEIAAVIYNKRKLWETFQQSDLEYLQKELPRLDKMMFKKIIDHDKKYCWISYQYKGPAYNLADFLGRLQALTREDKNPLLMMQKIKRGKKQLIAQQRRLLKKMQLSNYQKQLVKLSQRLVFIKDYRKMALYHGMYCYEPFFRKVGRRLGLSLEQVWTMNYWEFAPALKKNKVNVHELNERLKMCLAYVDKKRYLMLTGLRAKNFLKKIKFEKPVIQNAQELTGTCACPGLVQGTVRIVNLPEQMKKMNTGDIMVSHNTNPNLVPAMKMAGALISEAGGLTCHTAIVARELKTPCLVGVANATKIFKDGDLVEVDATRGEIKKIKQGK